MSDKSWELDLTLSLSHSLTLGMLNNFCDHVYAEKSHSHTLSLSNCHTLSFTLSRHAEQLLFSCLGSIVTVYSRLYVFLTSTSSTSPSPVTLDVIELVPG